jgi:hypothetical protein
LRCDLRSRAAETQLASTVSNGSDRRVVCLRHGDGAHRNSTSDSGQTGRESIGSIEMVL